MKKCLLSGLMLLAGILSAQTDTLPDHYNIGVITIRKPSFRVLSDAYAHYQFISGERLMSDTTSFDNRYASYDYCRVTLKNPHPRTGRIRNDYIRTGIVRNQVNKKTSFDLQLRSTHAVLLANLGPVAIYGMGSMPNVINMNRSFPEMKCFRRYDWMLSDTLTKKEFRKYIQRTRWYDIRIEYEEGEEDYTLVLKGAERSLTLQAYPFRNNSLLPEEKTRPDLSKLHHCYAKALKKEQMRFDKRVRKPLKPMQNKEKRQWEYLRSRYFSEEEAKMTKEEWLAYFRQVILNEQEYLPEAPFYPILFFRHLRYSGYVSMPATLRSIRSSAPCCIETDSSQCVVPKTVIFINRNTLEYHSQILTENAGPCCFLAELIPSGDFAALLVLNDNTLALVPVIRFDESRQEYILNAELFPVGILTIRAVMDFLDL
ncbi:MAG: hypothetical protein R6V49_02725 [Bacteroidales bacterium]